MQANRRTGSTGSGLTPVLTDASFRSSIREWLFGAHDYAWIVKHHSMRPLHQPIRLVFAANTALFAVCSVLLLASSEGPGGTVATTWAIVMLGIQACCIVILLRLPIPQTQRQARVYFVGFAIFGDVGLTSVLILYSPLVSAFGCALFALNSALCTYFVSSRWLLAHMAWAAGVIGYTSWRMLDAHVFDSSATVAGMLVLFASVCAVPVSAHVAWTLLTIDARQSLRDPLTGLHNRRGIEASLAPLWSTAQGTGSAISAVVIDIDDFKRINDTYGHDVGDTVLREISTRMLGIAGPGAVVGRTGGEEFTMLLTGTADDMPGRLAALPDQLRDTTESADVTVSVGAAVIESPYDHDIDYALRTALRTADARMYDAKRSGGGRTCMSSI